MIGLLARRVLTDRPRRTSLLLAGFGISVGVMIVLLSIGRSFLDQARAPDVVGGGDLVLLPEGIDVEVMKVGGATGMFFAIDQARFLYRQVLSGPRFGPALKSLRAPVWPGEPQAPDVAAASPVLSGKLVYLRKAGRRVEPRRALAHGVIPSLQRAVNGDLVQADGTPIAWEDSHADRLWVDPPIDSLYAAMDRFHLPPANAEHLDRWAEWIYFNFTDPVTGTYGFLSFIAGGDIAAGRGRALPLLQIVRPGAPPERFAGDLPLAPTDISTERLALRFGDGTSARFENGAWRLRLGWPSPIGTVRGEIAVRPVLDLHFPPFLIHSSPGLVSGYAVPALRASMTGWIEAGGRRLELQAAPSYHDHNWGTWTDVHWDWGTAANDSAGLFYGRIEHPELDTGRSGSGVFAMVLEGRSGGRRGGMLALFRPAGIVYAWRPAPADLPGRPERVPVTLAFEAAPDSAESLEVRADIRSTLATAPRPGAPERVFLQMRGDFDLRARVGGRTLVMRVPGFAETFVSSRDAATQKP